MNVHTGILMSHDINFVYFGVFNPQIDASLSFRWILKYLIQKNDCFSCFQYGKKFTKLKSSDIDKRESRYTIQGTY